MYYISDDQLFPISFRRLSRGVIQRQKIHLDDSYSDYKESEITNASPLTPATRGHNTQTTITCQNPQSAATSTKIQAQHSTDSVHHDAFVVHILH